MRDVLEPGVRNRHGGCLGGRPTDMSHARPIASRRTCRAAGAGPFSDERCPCPRIRTRARGDGRTVRGPAGLRAIPRRAGERALLKSGRAIDRRGASLCRGARARRQAALARSRRIRRGLAGSEASACEVALAFAFRGNARAERRDGGGGTRREVDDAPRAARGVAVTVPETRLGADTRWVGGTSRGFAATARCDTLGARIRSVGQATSVRRVAHAVLDADDLSARKQCGSDGDRRDASDHTHP
jgi:hypothetical protein